MRRIVALSLTLALLAASLMGCGGSTAPSGASNAGPSKPKKDSLVVAVPGDARSIDPHGAGDSNSLNALINVVEPLTRYNEKNEIVPCLAESWEMIDSQHFKFNLRKGVKFHNGEEMKASDVAFSFKRANTPAGAKVQYIMGAIDAENIEVVDDYTIIIPTKFPFSPFISYTPYIGAVIISEKYYTENPDAATHPIGTGPFKFVEWKKGNYLQYERFDEYWGAAPAYKDLTLRIIPESNSRMIELETGAVDIAFNIAPNDFSRVESASDLNLITTPSTVATQIIMNTTKAPLDNVLVRRAIDYAVNEEAIVKAVYRGAARYTSSLVTPDQLYADKEQSQMYFDVQKAKALIAEAGIKTPINLKLITNESQTRVDTATILQTQLKEIGINLDIQVLEAATYFDTIATGEHDICISGWGAVGFADPDNNLYGPIHTANIPANNYAYYSNPELDKLLETQRSLPNGPEREAAVIAAQRLIRSEVPYFTVDNPLQAVGVRSNVKGFVTTPASSHPVYSVYFE